jgi:hypothetical protein
MTIPGGGESLEQMPGRITNALLDIAGEFSGEER